MICCHPTFCPRWDDSRSLCRPKTHWKLSPRCDVEVEFVAHPRGVKKLWLSPTAYKKARDWMKETKLFNSCAESKELWILKNTMFLNSLAIWFSCQIFLPISVDNWAYGWELAWLQLWRYVVLRWIKTVYLILSNFIVSPISLFIFYSPKPSD